MASQRHHLLQIWLYTGLCFVALAGLLWVRGRNFVSVGTDWRVVLLAATAVAAMLVKLGAARKNWSFGVFTFQVAVLFVIGLVTLPAAFTALFGSPFTRTFVVSEKVQVRAGGCARLIELAEFQGRLDNRVCVSENIYAASSPGVELQVTGTQSRFGAWLHTIAR